MAATVEHDPQITRILRKSKVRVEVVRYLHGIYPKASYPEEIARQIRFNATNVLGALRGMNNKYKKESSLIECGMVERVEIKGKMYYKLSRRGMTIFDSVNLLR